MERVARKFCEVRGEVCVGTPNDVGNGYEPGTIEFCKSLSGHCFIRVRKTKGAETKFRWSLGSSITTTHDSLIFSEVKYCGPDILDFPVVLGTTEVRLKGADPNQLRLFIDNLPPSIKERLERIEQREDERQGENSQRQLREMAQRKENLQRQLREMQQREENSQRQLREMRQREQNWQRQLREMQQREENSQRQLREMAQREENLQTQLREMRQQEENSQRQLREMRQREENSQRQLMEMRQQLTNFEGQIREKEDEKANLEQQNSALERRLRVKEQEVNELELSLSTARQTMSDQRRQETCDWVIAGNEIQMTDRCLGEGGWGSVHEGTYCGCSVAVKQIHRLILSPHNKRLFEREMDIASKCRHPCLLQFIGATNDEGSPLFVTELMETSLRVLLEQRQLLDTEVTVISLDVARALNYLHQKKPSPIIHRDVSSANVLLWRQGDQWRAKVSDYGTANFMQQTMTVAPGNVIYSAPEALTSNQTVKLDVYSFGVFICEMCIRELPDPGKRDEQVVLVTNRVLRGLVRRCLQTDPEMRPNMQQIIDELEEFNETS